MAKSLRGEIEAELAGEKYTLRLGIGELEEIDYRTGLGTLELLRRFSENARLSHCIVILSQALHVDGKKLPQARVRSIIEAAGFRDVVGACISILTAVLIDPNEGNAEAVGAETQAPTA